MSRPSISTRCSWAALRDSSCAAKRDAVGDLERDVLPLRRDGKVEHDDVVTRERRRVGDDGRPTRRRRAGRFQRLGGEVPAELLGLGEADEDLRGDLVGGAAADRVVGRVLDHPAPREREELRGPRTAVQCRERLGVALEPALGAGGGRLDVDPRGRDVHQDVRAGAGAHLSRPRRGGRRRAVAQRGAERRELDPHAVVLRVRALDHVDELRERRLVVGAVHREHRVVAEERPHRLDQRVDRVAELVRRDQEVGGVAVAGRKVLGAHRRAVDAAPLEHVIPHRGRDSAPHDGVVEPVRAQDLRHLGDVPEHVRQIADAHLAAELARPHEPLLEVPPDRLAGDEELVHQHLPRPDREPTLLDERTQPLLVLGPDLEVVVDRLQLAVEREDEPLVRLHQLEHVVDQPDQLQAEALERQVPLAVPVRVGDQVDELWGSYLTEPASRPCTK